MSQFDQAPLTDPQARRVVVPEYVLGLGSAVERAAMARALDRDPALLADALAWETHFSMFNDAFAPTAPPASVWAGIEARLFAERAQKPRWYDSLAFWRAATGFALAGAVLAVGLAVLAPRPDIEGPELVAALQPVESDLSIVARYDTRAAALRLSGSGTPPGAANDYELWFILGDAAPISMGVFDLGEAIIVPVDPALGGQLAQGASLAVSREIAGGSPSGAPEGPIVAMGAIAAL